MRLYDPRHFALLGVFLTPVVPLYLAATNWGRMGRLRLKWLWLGFGLAGFALVTVALVVASPAWSTGQRALAIALQLGVGYGLALPQQADYESALRLGARRASLIKGAAAGVALTVVAIGVSFVLGVVTKASIEGFRYQYASDLAAQARYEQAIVIFDDLLQWDPEFDDALLARSICYGALERWDEAGTGLDLFLTREPRNPDALGLLASCRVQQGRQAEAESLAAVARELDPQVFTRLGFDFDSLAGAESPGPP